VGDVSALNLAFAVELTTEGFPFLDNAGAQQTPPELAHQYLDAAEKVAADTVTNRLAKVLTCDPAAPAGEPACAKTFISSFGGKAFRRPVAADQATALLTVWQVGRDTGGDFKSGVEAVITAVLQMPEFLYRFEMSPATAGQKLVALDGPDGGFSQATCSTLLILSKSVDIGGMLPFRFVPPAVTVRSRSLCKPSPGGSVQTSVAFKSFVPAGTVMFWSALSPVSSFFFSSKKTTVSPD